MASALDAYMKQALGPAYRSKKRQTGVIQGDGDSRQSLLSRAVRAPLSGLAAIGNILDIPGSMVRDTLGGENPLDQLLPWNWTSSEGRLGGRDLLRKWGAAGNEDTWGNWGAGIGAEIALDPLTYLSGGMSALGKGGQAARGAGLAGDISKVATKAAGRRVGPREARLMLTPEDLIKHADEAETLAGRTPNALAKFTTAGGTTEQLTQPIGGSLGLGLPFKQASTTVNLPYAQPIAQALDTAGNAVRYGKYSPVRPLATVFSKSAMGAMSAEGQKRAGDLSKALSTGEFQAKDEVAKVASAFESAGTFDVDRLAKETSVSVEDAGKTILKRSQAIRDYMEGINKNLPPDVAAFAPELDRMRSVLDSLPPVELGAGLKSEYLDDVIAYFPRQPIYFGSDRGKMARRAYATTAPFQTQRATQMRGHSGGTNVLDEMSLDPAFQSYRESSSKRALRTKGPLETQEVTDIADYIKTTYVAPGKLQLPADPEEAKGVLRQLAVTFGTLSPDHIKRGVPMFEPNPLKPYLARLEHSQRTRKAAETVQQMLADFAKPADQLGDAPTLAQVVNDMPGIDKEITAQRIMERMQPGAKIVPGTAMDMTKAFGLPQDIAKDAVRLMKGFTTPTEVNPFLEAVDRFTNLWKTGQTSIWPAFHWRNFVSGLYQNWIGDAFTFDSLRDAHNVQIKGRTVAGLAAKVPEFKGMTDAAATQRLREMMFAHDVTGYRQGFTPETLGDAVGTPFGGIPGAAPIWRSAPAGTTLKQRINPLNVAGVTGEDVFTPARVGRDLSKYIEGLNRGTSFIDLLKKGWDPAEAARRVKTLQIDYSNLSETERHVFRRVAPFYSFSRGTLPFHVEELASRPGGKLGRTLITAAHQRKDDEHTPDYVADTASIGLGTLPDGSKRYLTSFGAMFEDPAQLLPVSSSGVRGSLLEAGSRLNPLLKAPLEWMTNQAFFQKGGEGGGRPLDELDPTLGRTVANVSELLGGEHVDRAKPLGGSALEYLASNSPASRALFSLRTATDPRKLKAPAGLVANLLTGHRITDVSPAAQDALLRENAAELLKKLGAKTFAKTYIPEEDKAKMTTKELDQVNQLERIMKELAERAKQRKQERKAR